MDQLVDRLYESLKHGAVFVHGYKFDDNATELKITTVCDEIESGISELQYVYLPPLPENTTRKSLEFQLYKITERYHDLQSSFRAKKVEVKQQHLESLYIKSFHKSEFLIESAENENSVNLEDNNGNANNNLLNDEKLGELSSQEKLLHHNSVLTDKLQNVNAMLKSTLLAGEMNLSDLDHSTNTLSELSDSYQIFGTILNKTNSLVKEINKASKQERIVIYRAIYFFITVCCWILWRRIFKRPVLLLIWLIFSPLKLIFRNKSTTESLSPALSSSTLASTSIIETITVLATETIVDIIETELAKDEL